MDVSSRGPLSATVLAALAAPLHPQPDLPLLAASVVDTVRTVRPVDTVDGAGTSDGVGTSDGDRDTVVDPVVEPVVDTVVDEDVQLALYLMYELHYGLDGVDPRWEWAPDLLAARAVLETAFEADLRSRWSVPVVAEPVARTLFAMTDQAARPGRGSLAAHVARRASREQVAELVRLRSVYQLKEADPHTWAIPRLRGPAKAALVEIQSDEYGQGRAERMHATLFATTMRSLGLDDTPGTYLDDAPAAVLAGVNAISLFGLHRRLVGALCGHLAAFEMTSSLPARRWAVGLRRLGVPEEGVEFFDEHVEADAVHEQVAAHDLCGTLVEQDPAAHAEVLLGASVCLGLDELVGRRVLHAWSAGASALRTAGQRPAA